MDKRLIVVEATEAIYNRDGYLTRIIFEIKIMLDKFQVILLIPEKENDLFEWDLDVPIYTYPCRQGSILDKFKGFKSCVKKTQELIQGYDNAIVYAEALSAAMRITRLKGVCKVFDCHGATADELIMVYGNKIRWRLQALYVRMMEKRITRSFDLTVTVTKNQTRMWKNVAKSVILPMLPSPNFFDSNNYREKIRKELDIPEKATVFVYAGGNHVWQMSKETIDIYKQIEDKDSNSYLLILSGDMEEFTKLVRSRGIRNYKVLRVDYSEMPMYLDAADFGFCLRKDNIVNKVASPTKVLEYLARNVKPILTAYVGEFSQNLEQQRLACIIPYENNNELHNIISREQNYEARKYVLDLKNKYTDSYLETLSKI